MRFVFPDPPPFNASRFRTCLPDVSGIFKRLGYSDIRPDEIVRVSGCLLSVTTKYELLSFSCSSFLSSAWFEGCVCDGWQYTKVQSVGQIEGVAGGFALALNLGIRYCSSVSCFSSTTLHGGLKMENNEIALGLTKILTEEINRMVNTSASEGGDILPHNIVLGVYHNILAGLNEKDRTQCK